jgi:hypothetical protein
VPPQLVWPAGQHFPAEQLPLGQSAASQQIELAMHPAPHRLNPVLHWNPQVPAEQVAVAFMTAGHPVQEAPQELTLVLLRH